MDGSTAYQVDMRGEATSGKQLRDDMITFLIVRSSTLASMITYVVVSNTLYIIYNIRIGK